MLSHKIQDKKKEQERVEKKVILLLQLDLKMQKDIRIKNKKS